MKQKSDNSTCTISGITVPLSLSHSVNDSLPEHNDTHISHSILRSAFLIVAPNLRLGRVEFISVWNNYGDDNVKGITVIS